MEKLEVLEGCLYGFNDYGIKYYKDGKYYNTKGQEVTSKGKMLDVKPTRTWRKVKKDVLDAGGEWTNMEDGIKFLEEL